MRINLNFPQQTHYVTGSKYGKTVFDEQIQNQIKNSKLDSYDIHFPDTVKGVSISFVQGFIENLIHNYGKSEVLKHVNLKSNNKELENRLRKNMEF